MAFTQTDLDRIDDAIKSGVLKVKYTDKEVTYNSMSDLLKARELIRRELGLVTGEGQRILTKYKKGLDG